MMVTVPISWGHVGRACHSDDISNCDPLSKSFAQPLNYTSMEAWSRQQSVMEEANWLPHSCSLLLKMCMSDRL